LETMEKGTQHNYDLGKKAFDEKKYDTAQQYLEKVAVERAGYADVHNMLGLIYYEQSRFDDALKSFHKALDINPSYTEAALNLSVIYNELGRFDKSVEAYGLAKQGRTGAHSYLDPYVKGKLANMHADLGTIYKDLGFYTEAVEEYKKALRLRPEFVDLKTSLGVVYRDLRDFNSAVRVLQEAVGQNPGYPSSRIQLGLTFYVMGQHEKAKTEWLKVLREHPRDRMAQMYMNLLLSPSSRP